MYCICTYICIPVSIYVYMCICTVHARFATYAFEYFSPRTLLKDVHADYSDWLNPRRHIFFVPTRAFNAKYVYCSYYCSSEICEEPVLATNDTVLLLLSRPIPSAFSGMASEPETKLLTCAGARGLMEVGNSLMRISRCVPYNLGLNMFELL